MKEIDTWLQQYRNIWESRLNQLDTLLSTMSAKKQAHKKQKK
jgi:hypothetical protein